MASHSKRPWLFGGLRPAKLCCCFEFFHAFLSLCFSKSFQTRCTTLHDARVVAAIYISIRIPLDGSYIRPPGKVSSRFTLSTPLCISTPCRAALHQREGLVEAAAEVVEGLRGQGPAVLGEPERKGPTEDHNHHSHEPRSPSQLRRSSTHSTYHDAGMCWPSVSCLRSSHHESEKVWDFERFVRTSLSPSRAEITPQQLRALQRLQSS